MLLDIAAAEEGFRHYIISFIWPLQSQEKLADALKNPIGQTKLMSEQNSGSSGAQISLEFTPPLTEAPLLPPISGHLDH